jgi:two-component system CheB/CheR fusion protein
VAGWPWLPIPILVAATVLLVALDPEEPHDYPRLLLVLNFAFLTLSSVLVADLVGRTFAIRAAPGLLFLQGGMIVWGTGGLASAVGDAGANVAVTIFSACAWISGACHLSGVAVSLLGVRRVRSAGVWVPASYLLALTAVAMVTLSAHEGWLPTFFVEGAGGTILRQLVVGSACLMFMLTAFLLRITSTYGASAFGRWYAPALMLIAVGLFGLMVPSWVGSWLGWAARGAQYLGGIYMAVAAWSGLRESRAWGTSVELALRDTERRYDALFTNSLDAILLGDPHGELVAANPAACALFCRSEAEICQLGRAGLLAPGVDLDGLLRERQRTGEVRAEVQLVRGDGSRFHAELTSVLFDRRGRAFDIVRDVTDRREAEEALREADRRKDHFLAVLSHELRNPLAPIRNGIHILRRAPPGGEQARRAEAVIERQVDQLAHLVDELLDVTRISRNLVQLQRRRVELNELIRRTAEDHRSLFHDRGIRLEVELAPEPVHVDADANRLAQVLGNLLQNAAKFTGPGGCARVSLAADRSGGRAILRVSDDGVGMTPEMLSRLFQPFMQADETLDRSRGGLGLGLALVKGLIELHGGTIQAHSRGPGAGAEFEAALPLAAGPAADPEPPPPAAPRIGRRILVIEDNADAAETLRQVLELQGHQVVGVVGSGLDGLARARTVRPEVVLCDIGLPSMDGYAVARAFRADAGLKATHLVALSGYAQPEDLRRAADAGFDGHMAKPPDLDELERLLARLPAP